MMNKIISSYLAKIGSKGGKKSKRKLETNEARKMVKVREARRAFHRFKTSCFWSYDPNLKITKQDIPWVIEQLVKNGNREAWITGKKLEA
jgi:hypothetical protein